MRYLLVMLMAIMLAAPAHATDTATTGAAPAPAPHKTPHKAPHKPRAAKAEKGVTKQAPADTVAKALAAANKAPVAVSGSIVEKVKGKRIHYVFEDGTGRMTVLIGKKALKNQRIEAHTKVRLVGRMLVQPGKQSAMQVSALQLLP